MKSKREPKWGLTGPPCSHSFIGVIAFGFFLLLQTVDGFADGLDYSAGLGVRSLPLAASVFGQAGYGFTLWGDKQKDGVKYGYIRPSALLQTSVVVDRVEAAINVHPISFLGFQIGHAESWRFTDTATVDCTVVACRGRLGTHWLGAKLLFGVGPLAGSASVRVLDFESGSTNRPRASFAEEGSVLIGNAGQERLFSKKLLVAYTVSESIKVGSLVTAENMLNSTMSNFHSSLFFNKNMDVLSYTVGTGIYKSSLQSLGFTVYGVIHWTGIPSLDLD